MYFRKVTLFASYLFIFGLTSVQNCLSVPVAKLHGRKLTTND
ncbi:hypothetical protein SDC9_08771 [bioreactor metagenome]|uniref:Uncharacterized protein n=1 Tax=bioreactor metagenome TaxID=1076179 RepID=A0A644TB90_9ZZZZ